MPDNNIITALLMLAGVAAVVLFGAVLVYVVAGASLVGVSELKKRPGLMVILFLCMIAFVVVFL